MNPNFKGKFYKALFFLSGILYIGRIFRTYAPINSKPQLPTPPGVFELLKVGSFKFPPPRAKTVFKCPTLTLFLVCRSL